MLSKDADRITNRVDTDQTDLGLHCLLRPICPNISNYYGTITIQKIECLAFLMAVMWLRGREAMANNVDPDQMAHSVSNLNDNQSQHCLGSGVVSLYSEFLWKFYSRIRQV